MTAIIPKGKAKGVDNYYIVRSDLGYYMFSTNFHQGENLTVYSLHPSCQGGDHYLAHDDKAFYIIKGNSYRRVSNMSKDFDAEVFDLHPHCQGGDHYLSAYGYFYIIYKSRGVYHKTSNMSEDSDAVEYPLHSNCKDGLYYWGINSYTYFVKPRDKWGITYHKTNDLSHDAEAYTYSFHPDVLNFLPGGLAVTRGQSFGTWELIKKIDNDSSTPITWEKKIAKKVGYTKSKLSSIEHNWKFSVSGTYQTGTLTEAIAKFQISASAEYGGRSVNTEGENWEEVTEVTEGVSLTLNPSTSIYVWQYKLGFGKEDVLFCRAMKFTDDSNPPSDIPLPPSKD